MKLAKHFFLFLLMVTSLNSLTAQSLNSTSDKNNVIKLNIPALFFTNFSFQYETKTTRKSSFAVAVRYRPAGKIPFESKVEDWVNDNSIKVDLARIGNVGITPEYRFYLSKKGALQGFYIGPFISFNHYFGDVPVNYSDYVNNASVEKTAVFKGSTNAFTAGFQLGAQWKLSDQLSLDWWIVGPNYGFSRGNFDFVASLNDIEQISLQYELEKIQQTIPLITVEPEKPTASGAAFKVKGPWAGIRAFGINVGYRF